MPVFCVYEDNSSLVYFAESMEMVRLGWMVVLAQEVQLVFEPSSWVTHLIDKPPLDWSCAEVGGSCYPILQVPFWLTTMGIGKCLEEAVVVSCDPIGGQGPWFCWELGQIWHGRHKEGVPQQQPGWTLPTEFDRSCELGMVSKDLLPEVERDDSHPLGLAGLACLSPLC